MDMFSNMKQQDVTMILSCALAGLVVTALVLYVPKDKHEALLSKTKKDSSGKAVYDEKKVALVLAGGAVSGALLAVIYHMVTRSSKSSSMGFRFAMESCGCGI